MRIDPYRLEAMKRLHLPTIMGECGIQLKAAGRESFLGLCPFHEDKSPSLSVGKRGDKWLWHCFGCRASGNVIDFKMRKERIPFGDTYRALLPKVNGHADPIETPSPPVAPPVPPAAFLSRVAAIYHTAFCETKTAQDYLAGRGIKEAELVRHFQIGFCDGRLRRMLPDDPGHEFASALRSLGVLTERGGEFFQGCVTFPIFDENGAAVGMYGRRVTGQGWQPGVGGPAHLYLPGPHKGVWNGAAIKAHKDLIVTESIIDALSFCALGFAGVVPLYGVNGLTEDHVRLMKAHRTRHVLLCLDNDEAGRRARPPLKEKLSALGIEVADFILPSEYKDMNEALVKGLDAEAVASIAALSAVAARTPPSGEEMPPDAPVPVVQVGKGIPTRAADGPTVEEKEGSLFVGFGRRTYRVRGLTARNLEHLRVNVKVDGDGGGHLDTLDLYSSRAREAFVSCCRKVMKAEAGELAGELNRLIEVLEGVQARALGERKAEEERRMTPEEEAEALVALKSQTLLHDVLRDMESLGYVGEEANKAVGYLVGVSRKLDDPMSCVLMSQSSAGKSVLAETVEKLTPPEDILFLSRLTTNGLFYMKRDALKHKLLILEERVGAEAADYSIRTLQSKKKLTQAVPVKDESTGQIQTKTFEVEGPIAYIETTTRPRITDDNATRCFELTLDESAEQTKRIHDAQRRAKTLGGLKEKADREAVCRRHWNMQRLLKPVRVVIPYADKLDFPTGWLRTRRDHLRFLNLIEVISFLHQHQRPVEKTESCEYIAATVEDYKAAYDLAGAVMGESLTELKKPQRRLLEAVQGMAADGEGVTRREIREKVGLSDARLRELLGELVSLEYLRQTEGGGRGFTTRYRLADLVEGDERRLAGLTRPEALAARL